MSRARAVIRRGVLLVPVLALLVAVGAGPAAGLASAQLAVRATPTSVPLPPLTGYAFDACGVETTVPGVGDVPVYAPSCFSVTAQDCETILAAACDSVPLDIEVPRKLPDRVVVIRLTLRWDDGQGDRLGITLITDRTRRDGRVVESRLADEEVGRSPLVVDIVNPGPDRIRVLVLHDDGVDLGSTLEAVATSTPVATATAVGAPPAADGTAPPVPAGTATVAVAPAPAARATAAAAAAPARPDATGEDVVRPVAVAPAPSVSAAAQPTVDGLPVADLGGAVATGAGGHRLPSALLLVAAALLLAAGAGAVRLRPASTPEGAVTVAGGPATRYRRGGRLFWQLLLPFAGAVLLIGASGTVLTVRYLAQRSAAALDAALDQRAVAAELAVRDREVSLLEAERNAANIDGFPDALQRDDRSPLVDDLGSTFAIRGELDLLAATGPDGTGRAELRRTRTGVDAAQGTPFGAAAAVRAVLDGETDATGDKHSGLVRVGDQPYLLVSGPVRTDRLVGAVVAGQSLDRLATVVARTASVAVGFYAPDGERLAGSAPLPDRLPAGTSGGLRVRSREAQGVVVTAYRPLVIRGVDVGTLAVRLPASQPSSLVAGAALRVGGIVLVAMLAMGAIGVAVSRSLTRRVRTLVEANRAIGGGDLSARVPVRGGDEITELAAGINAMAEQLEASYADLERRVTERTEELEHVAVELQELGDARSALFASVSHELRTPLFAILAHAELMADPATRPADDVWPADYGATIGEAARMLVHRVDELLDLSASDAGSLALDLADVPVDEVVADVERQIRALGAANGTTVTTDVEPGLMVRADAARLVQILLNLGSNAVKYNRPGGAVRLGAAGVGNRVRLTVSDDGIGIPPEVGEQVFVPFYRVHGVVPRGQASTGLGLAVSQRLVEAHGGAITYESVPGEGTTFTVTLASAGGGTSPDR